MSKEKQTAYIEDDLEDLEIKDNLREIIERWLRGGVKVSKWMPDTNTTWCSMRIVVGGNPANIADRVAFIEKTPRIRIKKFTNLNTDYKNWLQGEKGHAPEYGSYQPSRDWCDKQLRLRGYKLPKDKGK